MRAVCQGRRREAGFAGTECTRAQDVGAILKGDATGGRASGGGLHSGRKGDGVPLMRGIERGSHDGRSGGFSNGLYNRGGVAASVIGIAGIKRGDGVRARRQV